MQPKTTNAEPLKQLVDAQALACRQWDRWYPDPYEGTRILNIGRLSTEQERKEAEQRYIKYSQQLLEAI